MLLHTDYGSQGEMKIGFKKLAVPLRLEHRKLITEIFDQPRLPKGTRILRLWINY